MTSPTMLVTGATGKTGSAVVERLRRLGRPVRAVVHRHDARSARLAALGAEVVVADMFDPDQLLEAARGTHRASFWALLGPPAFVLYLSRFQIPPEERALRHAFGDAFDRYERTVRRWL